MFIQLKLLKQNKQDQVFGEHTHICKGFDYELLICDQGWLNNFSYLSIK